MRFHKRRFQKLLNEARDRDLGSAELGFLQKIDEEKPEWSLGMHEADRAFDLLKDCQFEIAPSPDFNEAVLSRWETARNNALYWVPVAAGAVGAALALLALIQVLSAPVSIQNLHPKSNDAVLRDVDRSLIPTFDRDPSRIGR